MFSDDSLASGTAYKFYFVIEDGGKQFTSAAKEATGADVGATSIAFANQSSATQASGNWAAVPEPTSGLLMLLGVAGLALRRRHV